MKRRTKPMTHTREFFGNTHPTRCLLSINPSRFFANGRSIKLSLEARSRTPIRWRRRGKHCCQHGHINEASARELIDQERFNHNRLSA